ncbi:hypothetical protein V7S43_000285 [Phytophthora oleae]|uniref:Uncharacterized protein n=1 Tax=Phytophthora oleae TaxID=2107226 RepID=A0ABD3GAZ5_9STRA
MAEEQRKEEEKCRDDELELMRKEDAATKKIEKTSGRKERTDAKSQNARLKALKTARDVAEKALKKREAPRLRGKECERQQKSVKKHIERPSDKGNAKSFSNPHTKNLHLTIESQNVSSASYTPANDDCFTELVLTKIAPGTILAKGTWGRHKFTRPRLPFQHLLEQLTRPQLLLERLTRPRLQVPSSNGSSARNPARKASAERPTKKARQQASNSFKDTIHLNITNYYAAY